MAEIKVGVIVGSLRRDSFNKKLANAVIKLAPAHFKFRYVRLDDLPLYNQDEDASPPEQAVRLKREIKESDALLFVTPEYNRSVPGVLKNALDHGSRPYGDNSWGRKPAGIVGVSPSPVGTAAAQQHLRTILACLDAPTMGQPEMYLTMTDDLFDATGAIAADKHDRLQRWINRYVAWVEQHVTEPATA